MKYFLEFYVGGDLGGDFDTMLVYDVVPLYPHKTDLVDIGKGLHRVLEVHLVYSGVSEATIKVFLEKV